MAWVRVLVAWERVAALSLGSIRAATAARPSANARTPERSAILTMAWVRVAAASLGAMRGASTNKPWTNDLPVKESLVVLPMAWTRVAAAGEQSRAASWGSIRATTADRPCARDSRAGGWVVLA